MNLKINIDIFKKHNVKLAYLFGSRAKGNSGLESDFDVAVLFKKNPVDTLALNENTSLSLDLNKSFPAELDIVCLNYASSLLKYEVIRYGQILYSENEPERIDFEVSAIKEYIDEQPLRNLYNEALYKKILQGA
jgi:hypothetical protein